MITNEGLNTIRDRMKGDALYPTRMAVGIGTSTVQQSQTALVDQQEEKDISLYSQGNLGEVRYTMELGGTEAVGLALTEVGMRNEISANIVNRVVHSPVNKTSGMQIRYEVIYAFSNK